MATTRSRSSCSLAALFAANVSAVEIYQGFADGNSDLTTQRASANDFVGVQPSIGDSVSRYHGWADGNPDLFKKDGTQERASTGTPDIHMDLGGNPDLRF